MSRCVSRIASSAAIALSVGALAPAGLVRSAAAAVPAAAPARRGGPGRILAVGAENEYANVIAQIGGRYVAVKAIISNPDADPHTFEASPEVARAVAGSRLIVQNGLGYDSFMSKIESATPDTRRKVIVVQRLLGLPDDTPDPHLWYSPKTMPIVAAAVASALVKLDPAHAGAFRANEQAFERSLRPWRRAIAQIRARFAGAPVATTEPVADYLLKAAGLDDKTPFSLQADLMNGVDPSPQDVTTEEQLLAARRVKVLVYNRQVTDSLTGSFTALALRHHVPVVGVSETMPTSSGDYQSWMLAETRAISTALGATGSTAAR